MDGPFVYADENSYEVYSCDKKFGLKQAGVEITKPEYNKMIRLGDNAWIVQKRHKYGLIDNSGKIIIPIKYRWADRVASDLVKFGNDNDYGIYNVVYGFVTMFTVFNATFTAGINRYYNYELGKNGLLGVKKVYNVAMRIQTLFAVIVFFIVEVLGLWYVNNSMVMDGSRILVANWVFQFSVVSMIFLILQNPFSSAIMAFEKMDYFAVVSIIDVFLKLAIAIGIAYAPFDRLLFYGTLMASISVVNFFAYYIYCKRRFSECIK